MKGVDIGADLADSASETEAVEGLERAAVDPPLDLGGRLGAVAEDVEDEGRYARHCSASTPSAGAKTSATHAAISRAVAASISA